MTSPFRFDGRQNPETEEERRKRLLREAMQAAQLGTPFAAGGQPQMLPPVTVTAPRSRMLDASARREADLTTTLETALAEQRRRDESPLARLAGMQVEAPAADVTAAPRARRRPQPTIAEPSEPTPSILSQALNVAAQPLVQPALAGMRFREAVESTIGRERAAERARETQAMLTQAAGPKTGLAQAVAIPAAIAGEAVPYIAAGGGIPGLVRSAAITGLTSQRPGGSTVEALGELTGAESLQRLAESPYRTAADVALDVGLNVLPGAVSGTLRGVREATRGTRGLEAARAATQQVIRNVGEGINQVGPAIRATGQQLAQEPLTTAALVAGLAGETAVPGVSALAAALPATAGRPRGLPGVSPTLPQEVRSVGKFGFVRLPEAAPLNQALEDDHLRRVIELTDPILRTVTPTVTERAAGAGYFKGAKSPNMQLHFEGDATDEAIRRTVAIRGLAYGQDAQAWFREAKPTDAINRFAGWRIHDIGEKPATPEVVSEVMDRISRPDMFGGDAGATIDKNGHLIVMNFSDMPTENFNAKMQDILRDVATRHNVSGGKGDFYSEYLDGPTAYLQSLGQDTEGLRGARDALVGASAEYERYAAEMGADLAETADRLAATRNLIEGRLDALSRETGPLGQMQRELAGVKEEGVEIAAQRAQQNTAERLKQRRDRGPLDLSVGTPAQRSLRVAKIGFDDLKEAVSRFGKDASEWYSKQGQQASAQIQTLEPRLRGSPEKRFISNVILALTSSGATVEDNLARAMPIIRQWLDTGQITQLDVAKGITPAGEAIDQETKRRLRQGIWMENLAGSTRAAAIEPGLRKLQLFLDANGGDEKAVRDFFRKTYQTKVGDIPTSADVFGPKVGRFLMNVEGAGNEVTVDSWALRTWMRWMGYGDEARMTFDKDAVSPENPQGLVLRGGPTPEENVEIRQAFTKLASQISKETGQKFEPADVQALLWYWEKFNYGKWGSKSDLESFADVGNRFVMEGREPMPQMSNVAGQPYTFKFGAGPVTSGLERKATREYLGERGAPLRVYDIGGAAGEALRRGIQEPGLAAAIGAGTGALTSEEDRFGGAARGALAGAAIATGVKIGGEQLLRAKQALRSSGMPQELAEAYARSRNTIDFSGKAAQAIARRARGGFRDMAKTALANYEDGVRELDRISGTAEAAGMAPEKAVGTALDRALGSDATVARAISNGMGKERGGVIDPITREIVNEPLEDVFAVLGKDPKVNELALTYVTGLRRLGRYDEAMARLRQWDALAERASSDAEAALRSRPPAGMDDAALAEQIRQEGQRAAEQALGPRPTPNVVYGGDLALMEADRVITPALGQRTEFQEFATRLEQYMDSIGQYMVKSGVWSPEQYAAMRNSDAFYIPFKRLLENVQATQRRGGGRNEIAGRVTAGVKEFTGSRLMLANPAEALGEYVSAAIKRADRYRVGSTLIDTINQLGDTNLLTRIEANDPLARSIAQKNAEDAYRLRGFTEEQAGTMAEMFRRVDRNNPVIWKNGPNGREYYLVNDKSLIDALENLNPGNPGAAVTAIVGALAPLKRLTTAFATGYAPGFWLGVNMPRDILVAKAQNPDITLADVAVGFREAFKSIAGRSEMVERISRQGAGQVSQFGGNLDVANLMRQVAPTTPGQQVRGTLERGLTAPMRGLERVGRATEMPMRLASARAAERRAAEAGISEAGQQALGSRAYSKATVDFRRRGGNAVERFFEQTVPFYGAAKKGGVAFGRAMKDNPQAVGAVATGVILATMLEHITTGGQLGGAFTGDAAKRQEDTNRLAWERARAIRVGDFRVTLPQEMAVVSAATRVALAALERDDPFVYAQLQEAMLAAIPPIYSDLARGEVVVPFPVMRQMQEIAQNRSAFTGRPIVPESMTGAGVGRGVLPEQRRYETTAPTFDVMAAAARGLGFEQASPLQAEYLARGVTGRFTPAITAVTDVAAAPMAGREAKGRVQEPLMRQPLNPLAPFVVPPPRRTQAEEEYFKLRNDLEAAKGTHSRFLSRLKTARERNDVAGEAQIREEVARLRKSNPLYEMVYQNTGQRLEQKRQQNKDYKTVFDKIETAQDKLEALRTKQEKVQEAVANNRMTQTQARKELDRLSLERAALYRRAYNALATRMPQ